MYSTLWQCPTAVRLCRSNFARPAGHIFLTIWSPTEPASREVRSPLQPFLRFTPTSLACKHLELLHTLLGLGDIQLVGRIVAHDRSLLFFSGSGLLPEGTKSLDLGVLCADAFFLMIGDWMQGGMTENSCYGFIMGTDFSETNHSLSCCSFCADLRH